MSYHPNPAEICPKKLRKHLRYITKHWAYLEYLRLLLDRASLPANTHAQPNVTNMAAMVQELRHLYPHVPDLNSIVFGRVLNRVLPSLLTWHGGQHVMQTLPRNILLILESTVYRFPEIERSRAAFESFLMSNIAWSNHRNQWQWVSRGEELE